MRSPLLRYLPLLIFALGAAALLRIGGQSETPLRGSLDSIPRELAGYSGQDQTVSKDEQRVAGMDQYLMRTYVRDSTGSKTTPVANEGGDGCKERSVASVPDTAVTA